MNINATLINLFRICKRECWLHANGINMEQSSDLVADGKVIEQESYQQRSQRFTQLSLYSEYQGISLSGKVDFYDTRDKIVHETKRSNKVEDAHVWQVKFYLWLMMLNGIEATKGIIEYPRLRQKESVILNKKDITYLKITVSNISHLIQDTKCPPVLNAKICKSCSYYDFCYSGED